MRSYNSYSGGFFMIEYALIAKDDYLYEKIREFSINNFYGDINCPISYEPSGTDFLSPCLAEASLMSLILEKEKFNIWFKKFIPSLKEPYFKNIINPPKVLDPEDPGIGNLIGLMFHRAWTLKDIALKIRKNKKVEFKKNEIVTYLIADISKLKKLGFRHKHTPFENIF